MSERIVIPSGAAELVCDVTGSGPPIVCLHAGVADRRVWAATADHLSEKHRVYAYDRRGFGETVYTPESFSHVADLGVVIERVEADSVVVVGNSDGGRIAIDYALDHPEHVLALVLVAPAISGEPPPDDLPPRVQELDDAIEAAGEAGDLAEVNRLEAHLWLDGATGPEGRVRGEERALFLAMNERALTAPDPGEALRSPNAWDRLDTLAVPTLVLFGDLDLDDMRSNAQHLAAQAQNARFVSLGGVAHLPMLEDPDSFSAVVEGFLGSL